MRLLLTCLVVLMGCSANAQALWRNFFTTNQNPRVTVAAGSNVTVQASTVGVDQRIFTVNAIPGSNQTNWPLSSITNANYLTNWATIDTNYVPPFAGFATNASNATNFWGVLNTTNIPSLNYISNNAGWGTNTSFSGVVNASNEVLTLSGIGTTISPILFLTNATAASLGAQQSSPALMLGGQGWRSGNSTTMPVQMGMYVLPVQGSSANPTARLTFVQSISNAAPSGVGNSLYLNSDGAFSSLETIGSLIVDSSALMTFKSRSKFACPADGDMQIWNQAASGFTKLILGKTTSDWLALKVEASTNNPTLSIRTGADGNYASLVASNMTATGGGFFATGPTSSVTMGITNTLVSDVSTNPLVVFDQTWQKGTGTALNIPAAFLFNVTNSGAGGGTNAGIYSYLLSVKYNGGNVFQVSRHKNAYFGANIYFDSATFPGIQWNGITGTPTIQGSNNIIYFFNDFGGSQIPISISRTYYGGLNNDWPMIKVEASTNNPTLSIRTGADGNYASLVASNVFGQFQGVTQPLHAHASLMLIGDETVDLVSQSTYYAVTNYDAAVTNLMGASAPLGTITNYFAGWYDIRMAGSGLGTSASSQLYECAIYTNNVECTLVEWQRSVTSTARGSFAAEGTVYLPAGCWINARIKSDAATPDDFTFGRLTLTVSSP